jgi:hypothetical protein
VCSKCVRIALVAGKGFAPEKADSRRDTEKEGSIGLVESIARGHLSLQTAKRVPPRTKGRLLSTF